MPDHERLNYVEFATSDIASSKQFFGEVFGWIFEDFGPAYTAFYSSSAGIDGGFFVSENVAVQESGAALIIFYSAKLEETLDKVKAGGGSISKEIFSFPGGRRFQFIEPGGNELAVWGAPLED